MSMAMRCIHIREAALRPPTSLQHVYKDECCTCFHSQDDPEGIDVCLSCFHAGCLATGRAHAVGHYELNPNHAIALNIRRTKRPKADMVKATKLEIGSESDADRNEYHTKLKCLACDIDLDSSAGDVSAIVDGVMKSLSSAQQSEVKAWEQEMIACLHTETLVQDPARDLGDQNLATCSKCELNENLWLCLVCGTLSCGRPQFGGGGGNGHGLQHVDSTNHTLAVKLGSITPEGTADVYCYSCDEERIDPKLQEHLAHWGIRLADRVKTERSLQEMQIEQNMKWEFSLTAVGGVEMRPLYGPGFTGIINIGNSCYLASIIQCLFSLPQFCGRFYEPFKQDPSVTINEPGKSLEVQMRKIADGLLSGEFSRPATSDEVEAKDRQQGISPSMLKALIGKDHSEFSTMRQQDAFEFLMHLSDKLGKLAAPGGFSDPVCAFRFTTEQRTQCLSCMKVAYRSTNQESISVAVPARLVQTEPKMYESIQLRELLEIYTAEEVVEYSCAACQSKAGASKRTLFKTFPDVLVLNPGRFAIENWVPQKLEIPVIVPDAVLELDDFLSKGQQASEELLPEESENASELYISEADIEALMAMGFPKVRCQKALLATGSGSDGAMEWLFSHMDDADIDDPIQKTATGANAIDESIVENLADMGFPIVRCRKAVQATHNSGLEPAMDWLMQHMEDADIDIPSEINGSIMAGERSGENQSGDAVFGTSNLPARYIVRAMACHKGSSIHTGHYVAFVRRKVREGDAWVLYNDEKVLEGVDWQEASKTAYVYFFERVTS